MLHHHYVKGINIPIDFEDLRIKLIRALSHKRILEEVEAIKDEINRTDIDKVLGKSNLFLYRVQILSVEHLHCL